MWSQCSLEVLYSSSVELFQFLSIKQSLENRGLAFKAISECGSPLFRFQFCYVTPVINCIFECKPWRVPSSPELSSWAGLHEAASFVSLRMTHSHHWAHHKSCICSWSFLCFSREWGERGWFGNGVIFHALGGALLGQNYKAFAS